MNVNSFFDQLWPIYSQTQFWLTALAGLALWYLMSLALAHMMVGGGKEPVSAVSTAMFTALIVGLVLLAVSAWFLIRPTDLIYMVALSVTFGLLALILTLTFSSLGRR
ncbi:hypothetical protein [Deinococcus radiophilus]|uniref:Uncharacterized protein n=1 Tax=Deinococcus radiophilus TaxID=32062 RepID=A0A3S0JHH7_9DEIO|nr:hypothetical protein [Deinococcus radiophilus]RTR19104.1 hypothetical protein EJ104_13525 [Deinococcus radiophilus]UFA51884.1 hypothetical protein LMT64_12655 [Deinococcus radiophilus]